METICNKLSIINFKSCLELYFKVMGLCKGYKMIINMKSYLLFPNILFTSENL